MDKAGPGEVQHEFLIDSLGFVPENKIGAISNSVAALECTDELTAEKVYAHVRDKFTRIQSWEIFAGKEKAHFALTGPSGIERQGFPSEGDHIRIQLPAFRNNAGEGYDWVKIYKVDEDHANQVQFMKIEVHPTTCPLNAFRCIAHFFDAGASSTFLLLRNGNVVQMSIHGRNETTNRSNNGLMNLIRNFIVSKGGILGGSKLQWQALVNGLIETESDSE